MDWDTPPRTRRFALAALLVAAAGLLGPERRPERERMSGGPELAPALDPGTAGPRTEGGFFSEGEKDVFQEQAAFFESQDPELEELLRDALAAPGAPSPAELAQPLISGAAAPQTPARSQPTGSAMAALAGAPPAARFAARSTAPPSVFIKERGLSAAFKSGATSRAFLPNTGRSGPAQARATIAAGARPRMGAASRAPRRSSGGRRASAAAHERSSPSTARLRQAAAYVRSLSAPKRLAAKRRFKPLLLPAVLGKNAIRPPRGSLKVPDLRRLAALTPKSGPRGRRLPPGPATLSALEKLRPPSAALKDCRKSGGHWHSAKGAEHYHAGGAWGRSQGGGWAWFKQEDGRWWSFTAEGQPTWLEQSGRWWWQSDGVWFLLHQGEAWGYRTFSDAKAEGLIHPTTGTRMLYSADGRRVAVVTPGDGAAVFDARSGAAIARWEENQLKKPVGPQAPTSLTLPR